MTPVATKTCTRCKLDLPVSEFYLDNRTGRPRGKCKPCFGKASYESRKKRPHHRAKQSMENRIRAWKALGMTPEWYGELLQTQNGVCAICGEPESERQHLSVDHDHETNEVRGLLCNQCNTALGKFKDDPNRLRAAIKYLG